MNGRCSASMLRLGSTKVCYTLLLALAIIKNSGDASAAEACTTPRYQQRRLSTWVSDCTRSSEYYSIVNLLTLGTWALLRVVSGYSSVYELWGMTNLPHLAPRNSAMPKLQEHFRRAARRERGWAISCSTGFRSVVASCGRCCAGRLPSMSPHFRVAHKG